MQKRKLQESMRLGLEARMMVEFGKGVYYMRVKRNKKALLYATFQIITNLSK